MSYLLLAFHRIGALLVFVGLGFLFLWLPESPSKTNAPVHRHNDHTDRILSAIVPFYDVLEA